MTASLAKRDLIAAVAKAASFIPNTSAGRSSVITLAPNQGYLRLSIAYPDGNFTTHCNVEDIGEAPEVSLYGKRFIDIVGRAEGAIKLSWDDTKLTVHSGKSKWTERALNRSVKAATLTGEQACTFVASELLHCLKEVQYAADKNSMRPTMFVVDVQDGRVRATNGSNYHEAKLVAEGLTFQVSNQQVPSFLKLLKAWGDNKITFTTSDTSYGFKLGGDLLTMARLDIPFPDLDAALLRPLKAQASFTLKVRRTELEAAIRKVKLSSSDDFPYVEAHLTTEECLLKCEHEGSEAVSSVKAVWANTPRIATFNIDMLQNFISSSTEDILEIRMAKDTRDRKSPFIMGGGTSWSMVTQLKMRPRK